MLEEGDIVNSAAGSATSRPNTTPSTESPSSGLSAGVKAAIAVPIVVVALTFHQLRADYHRLRLARRRRSRKATMGPEGSTWTRAELGNKTMDAKELSHDAIAVT